MSSWLQKQSNPKLYRQHSSSSIPLSKTAQKEQKPILEIYTDWANHYLDKLKGRPKIRSLTSELSDGLLLADVIEAVTGEKVPDVVRKPGKSTASQISNIQASLNFLVGKGIPLGDIRASEIHEGSLKAILGLFFQLSRFKQQQKGGGTSRIGRPSTSSGGGVSMTLTLTQQQKNSKIASPTSKKAAILGRIPTANTSKLPPSSSNGSQLKPPKVIKSVAIGSGIRPPKTGIGKRTSSSSGFSAPKTLNDPKQSSDTNFPSPSALRRINDPRHRSSALPKSCPKRSPKLVPRPGTEIKDYGLIDTTCTPNYPPHAGGPSTITIRQIPSQPPSGCSVRPLPQPGCNLPRRRRGEEGPSAVAVVSPMPASKERTISLNEEDEDPLKGLEPMKPLGLFSSSAKTGPNHHLPFGVVKRKSPLEQGQDGFLNKDASPRSVAVESGYMSDGGDLTFNGSNGSAEDGYMSEGGMSFYAKRLSNHTNGNSNVKSEVVPDLLSQTESGKGGIYRVVGGRRHIQKNESAIQTDTDWKKALAHNARVLSSQEKAMDEYLRRQRAVAKQQLSKDSRHRSIGTKEDGRGSSIPGTPEPRRNLSSSLERGAKKTHREQRSAVASPMSSRKNFTPPASKEVNTSLGSKSLPKGTSSLNYGLMMDRIQQKRQRRPSSSKNDGSLSDSNYATYSEINRSSSPYSWLQPASTYAHAVVDPYSAWNESMGSNESLNSSVSSSIQHARANSLSKAKLLMMQQQRISPGNPHRRTLDKSDQSETEYYGIPLRPQGSSLKIKGTEASPPGYIFASTHNYNGIYASNNANKSLSKEEQTNMDIFKLRKELEEEHDKVKNLTSQLATNSHVVAAFQQSLANMSNRLLTLTMTAEQKDTELNELRMTIDKVRQSGVDFGLISSNAPDFSRQISSESFLSDASDSEDRPDGKKKSKRSGWLRHSFSKAFSRGHKMKSKGGSISDAEDGSITKALYEQERCASAASVRAPEIKGSQSSSALDDDKDIVTELQRQLLEKDELLTETRLEALSSAHQLEALRETVSKMRSELQGLKCDNEKLSSIVNASPVTKSSSSSSISSAPEDEVKRRLSSHIPTLSGLSSLDLSATTDPTHKDGGKLVPVSVCGELDNTRIGVIVVSGKSTWELLESLIQRLFKEYVMRVDPVSNLGLAADSIAHYQVGEIRRRSQRNPGNPEMLPYGYLVGDTTDIKVCLRKSVNHVDALAFETLIPKSLVQRYVSLLMEHRRIILSGPTGTGKTFIARKLANFLVQRKRESMTSSPVSSSPPRLDSVANFTVSMNNVNELREYLIGISEKCNSTSSAESLPTVIVLDNLHLAGQLDEVFNNFLKASFETCPYIIGTLNQSTTSSATTHLQLKHNFRWILCAYHMEPVRGFLGRYLRRKLLVVETSSRVFDAEMSSIVDWISKIYSHLNKFLETHSSCGDITFGPRQFLNCPMDASTCRNWFINLWNTVLIPYMTDALREAIQLYGKRASWEDPFAFVQDTWPWSQQLDELSRIKPEDVGFQGEPPAGGQLPSRPNSTGGDSLLLMDELSSPSNADPLFNMLMHLQEAAANNERKEDDEDL